MWSKVRYVGSSIPLLEPRRSRIHPNLVSLWRNLFQAINMVPIDSKLFFLLCVLRIEVSKIIIYVSTEWKRIEKILKDEKWTSSHRVFVMLPCKERKSLELSLVFIHKKYYYVDSIYVNDCRIVFLTFINLWIYAKRIF